MVIALKRTSTMNNKPYIAVLSSILFLPLIANSAQFSIDGYSVDMTVEAFFSKAKSQFDMVTITSPDKSHSSLLPKGMHHTKFSNDLQSKTFCHSVILPEVSAGLGLNQEKSLYHYLKTDRKRVTVYLKDKSIETYEEDFNFINNEIFFVKFFRSRSDDNWLYENVNAYIQNDKILQIEYKKNYAKEPIKSGA